MSDDELPPASTSDALTGPRAELAKAIPRRPRVSWWLGVVLAVAFALLVMPSVAAERWLGARLTAGTPAPVTVRLPLFSGYDVASGHIAGGGSLIARGEVPDAATLAQATEIDASLPHGAAPVVAYLLLLAVLAGLFAHHMRRSTYGRLLRVQLVNLALIVALAVVVKLLMLATTICVLVIPVALFAMVPTLALDRVVGLATGILAALVVSLLVPFDPAVTVLLLVQAGAAGLVIAERPKRIAKAALSAGAAATLFTAATYPLMLYLTTGRLPLAELANPLHSAWLACALGPAVATALAVPLVPLYQLLVGEITQGKLVALEDHQHPLLRQIATRAPGTWQHSLMMANMAEIAASAIGANGRLVRVGALFHDLGKSLQPKYFIENLEPGETSPHDKLPPDVSCDRIFAHVTEGIVTARKSGLHERIIDFMHMHHGNGVLEYFWGKTKDQGNPKGLTVEDFRYPGVPPQSRETAILSICDAVEAASRTLKTPTLQQIDNLVQRIVYGKLHLGQLDDSGLSMGELRRITESLRETIRHANHTRIEYPWQKAQQDASAPANAEKLTQTGPRLDSLDRPTKPDTVAAAPTTAPTTAPKRDTDELATSTTAPQRPAQAQTWKASASSGDLSAEVPLKLASSDVITSAPDERPSSADTLQRERLSASELLDRDRLPVADTLPAETKRPSQEALEFAAAAKEALEEAAKDFQKPEVARKRAATLPPIKPPIKPPTIPPPIAAQRPLTGPSTPPSMTIAPPSALRPPAPVPATPAAVTSPPPLGVRPPGINYLDDMITLRPQYAPRAGIAVTKDEDGSVRIEPRHARPRDEDAVVTRPRMLVDAPEPDAGETAPNLELPLRAPPSSPTIEFTPSTLSNTGIAARIDAQLLADEEAFSPDVTRQQTVDEIDSLRDEARDKSLDVTRRVPFPTAEVDEQDIEAAIELAPPARRNSVGVAKKPPE